MGLGEGPPVEDAGDVPVDEYVGENGLNKPLDPAGEFVVEQGDKNPKFSVSSQSCLASLYRSNKLSLRANWRSHASVIKR